jgi:hypothetical protein
MKTNINYIKLKDKITEIYEFINSWEPRTQMVW